MREDDVWRRLQSFVCDCSFETITVEVACHDLLHKSNLSPSPMLDGRYTGAVHRK